VFLSIDLDAWNGITPTAHHDLLSLMRLPVPVTFVGRHEHMLTFINRFQGRHLVNIDWHDDLVSEDRLYKDGYIHCGNWATAVNWRGSGRYTWLMFQEDASTGYCNGDSLVWGGESPTGWGSIHKRRIVSLKELHPRGIQEIVIAVSYEYLVDNKTALEFLKSVFGSYRSVFDNKNPPITIIQKRGGQLPSPHGEQIRYR
jgi:hypothetical protein